jgi:hypothetical protein
MRVPWRDRPWDARLCTDPLGNSSCVLHSGIGPRRDDDFEAKHHDAAIDTLDHNRLPCLTERGMFMSPLGYTVVKKHPYKDRPALRGMLHDTPLTVPPFAFESMPFRWLNREILAQDVGHDRVPGYIQDAEDDADSELDYKSQWLMDSRNQKAAIDAFFNPVQVGRSLVFAYLKHSPLQETRSDRLLVGAALVTGLTPPSLWRHSGSPPFQSLMWETIVGHSLRSDMANGVLLPYQEVLKHLDEGEDIERALAWAPDGREVEFSYVTEHLSDDAAIEALSQLAQAVDGARALGIDVPASASGWIARQSERLWQVRGPAPGLPGVLKQIGVQQPYVAARIIADAVGEGGDPWGYLEGVFASPQTAPQAIRPHVGLIQAKVWKNAGADKQDVLRLLSGFDIRPGQVDGLFNRGVELLTDPTLLLDNPYYASTCTYESPDHVPFKVVDRALFPPPHVTWNPALPERVQMSEYLDRRRIEALFADVLEQRGVAGDTVLPAGEVIALANDADLTQQPALTSTIIAGIDLDHAGLSELDEWSPLVSLLLADETPGYKLERFEHTSNVIRAWVNKQLARDRLGKIASPRLVLDHALRKNKDITGDIDEVEDRARTEKAAGLSVLHDAPLSVLIGPAGTGKTTLLRALVEHGKVATGGVLLLAPTGKARVQLQLKVGRPAKTLASYLAATDRYDGETGRYIVRDDKPRRNCALVVIDEASMLTEQMLAATLDSLATVQRMVLVGDPRQLPPIGPGRPFVDIVRKLDPRTFEDWVRVAGNYVELQIPRRQLADGSHGVRHDLELATWFGGGPRGAADDSIWDELASNPDLPSVQYIPWGGRTASEAITDALVANLDLSGDADSAHAFSLTYGAERSGEYINWEPGAGPRAEEWQILSPTRSRASGTVELNRQIKRTYRSADTARGQKNNRGGNIPRPIGPELIVRGDKVMQTENKHLVSYPKDGEGINYVANGEIGVGIGRIVKPDKTRQRDLSLPVEFSSQPGYKYYYSTSAAEDPLLELAWAITVHKSQGSEFKRTFLVISARANVSRELMYTALTRQRDKVIILHEGTLEDLRALSEPWRSEIASRLTDLFALPRPYEIEIRGKKRRYDRTRIHVSAGGTMMASKNEIIIADILDQLVPEAWLYEEPFAGADGRNVDPDFTISTPDGRTVYWEHAGMLDRPDYARKWELKQAWYAENGVLPHLDGGGERGTLMWTDDLNGVDVPGWRSLAEIVLGVTAGLSTAGEEGVPITPRGPRRSPT